MRWRNETLLALAMVLSIMATSFVPALHVTAAQENGNPESHSLSLTLSTNKQTYYSGEPIQFTATLLNASSNGIWVGNTIVFADIPGSFVMTVIDAQGNPMHGDMAHFAGAGPDFRHVDLFTWIRQTRLVLGPGNFLGMTAKLQDYKYDLTKPGKYKLQVSYSDIGYKELQEEGATANKIKKAKQQAIFSLWSGSIRSSEAWIEVVAGGPDDKS